MKEKSLTLVEHLEELRKRVIIVIISVLVGGILSYFFINDIVELVVRPAKQLEFIYLSPPELFLAYVKIAAFCGVVVASPVILFQVGLFISPGIEKKDKIYLTMALFFASFFFILGVAFAYFAILPLTIKFFVEMGREEIVPLFSFASYISFVSSILLAFGVTFELPLLVMLLTQFNLVKPPMLIKSRKFIILGIFVLAAILTPPDVVSQMLLAGPMIVLFEFSILVSSFLYKNKLKRQKSQE